MVGALADELALLFRALLFLFSRISLLVRAVFPSFVLNSILVLEFKFFFLQIASYLGLAGALTAGRDH